METSKRYRLVHVKQNKWFSPANAARNIQSNGEYLVSYWPSWPMEESDMASFFFIGPGLSLGVKLVSTNDRPSYFSIIFRLFPNGGEKQKLRRNFHEPIGGSSKYICRNFRARNRRSDPPVFNSKQNLARKLYPTLKPSNLNEMTHLTHFFAQTAKCPRRFWEIDPQSFAHVVYTPIPRPDLHCCCCCCCCSYHTSFRLPALLVNSDGHSTM